MKEEIIRILQSKVKEVDSFKYALLVYDFNEVAEEIEQLIENAIEANDCAKMDRR